MRCCPGLPGMGGCVLMGRAPAQPSWAQGSSAASTPQGSEELSLVQDRILPAPQAKVALVRSPLQGWGADASPTGLTSCTYILLLLTLLLHPDNKGSCLSCSEMRNMSACPRKSIKVLTAGDRTASLQYVLILLQAWDVSSWYGRKSVFEHLSVNA